MDTRSFWQQFHDEHGDCVSIGDGWFLFEDGAMREQGHMGGRMDPPSDPLERAKKILQFREIQLKEAEQQFHDFKKQTVDSNAWQWDQRAEETLAKLKDLQGDVEHVRELVEEQQALVNELNPRYIPPEEQARIERQEERARVRRMEKQAAFQDKLSEIKI